MGSISNNDGTGIIRSANEQYGNAEYYYFKMNNIGNFDGKCDFSDMSMINASEEEYYKYRLKEGDFLFNTRNSVELVGKSAVIHNLPCDNILYNNNLLKISFGNGIDADYISYYFISSFGRNALRRFVTSTTNVAAIYQRQIITLLLPIPPTDEQRRIVKKLDALLAYIDIIDELQQQYESDLAVLKGKIIDAGIRGKLTEQLSEDGDAETLYAEILDQKAKLIKEKKIKKEKPLPDIEADEIPFGIPKNWKWVRLGELIRISSGTGLTSSQMGDGDIPVYGGNGIAGYHNESLVNEETIVIGRVGFYCGSVHVTPAKAWVTDNAFITQYPKEFIDRDFLVYALKYMDLRQNTNGAAQPVVSGKKIYPLAFALPPLAEQKRISKKIDEVVSVVEEFK